MPLKFCLCHHHPFTVVSCFDLARDNSFGDREMIIGESPLLRSSSANETGKRSPPPKSNEYALRISSIVFFGGDIRYIV